MHKKQKIVAIGALIGVLTMIALVLLFNTVLPSPRDASTLVERLAFTLQFNVFAIFPLFIMIANIGNGRFLSDAINPLANAENDKLKIDGRVADNTLQQYLFFLVGTLALSTVLTEEQMKIIPALTLCFIIGRIVFWIGYRKNPLYRAPGMAATSYMNLGILAYTMYRVIMLLML